MKFQREERYIVIKLSDMEGGSLTSDGLKRTLSENSVRTRECVVVEADWPIYDQTWDAVQRMAEGREQEADQLREERDALAAHQVDLARELTACQFVLHSMAHCGEVSPDYADGARAVLRRTKDASLARRDARMKAEALRELREADLTRDDHPEMMIEERMWRLEGHYRKQAEETQHGH